MNAVKLVEFDSTMALNMRTRQVSLDSKRGGSAYLAIILSFPGL